MLGTFFDRISSVTGDAAKTFTDMLAFLGFITLTSFLGGLSYGTTYYQHFGLSPESLFDFKYASLVFVRDVLLSSSSYILISLCILAAFALVYFCARYVWKAWFGYVSLCLLFGGSLILSTAAGRALGNDRAESHWRVDSELPFVSVFPTTTIGTGQFTAQLGGGTLKLLFETSDVIYLIEPKDTVGGQGFLSVISKKSLTHMRLTPTTNK